VHKAVLPAITPERATLFLGFGASGSIMAESPEENKKRKSSFLKKRTKKLLRLQVRVVTTIRAPVR
jgi:hypothetical protein